MCCNSLILDATVVSVDREVFTPIDEPDLVWAKMWGKLSSKGNGRGVLVLQMPLSKQQSGQRRCLGNGGNLDGSAGIREIVHQVLNIPAKASRKKKDKLTFE